MVWRNICVGVWSFYEDVFVGDRGGEVGVGS